ncbi:hypothetical protein HNP84_005902 [Thermocatellispora tengchongensis]|uniref:Uncharacterized protein n=1 Tax=Thermocatellispora tengchongensis TaxID=1073253 RepID=A0A840P914_9ACTN|nr:hypothetical protein [Thermocatellispora tengchongensis]MBB5136158.1 hypothetical protein [Thermocatellispora tengchongensis]
MSATTPTTTPRPGPRLMGALPAIQHLIEQMSTALGPAMNDSYDARDDHGSGDGYTEAMWTLLKALTFAGQAARAAHIGDIAEQREVDTAAYKAAGYARHVRAAAAGPAELAALEASVVETRQDLGDATVERITVRVGAYMQDSDTLIEDEPAITLLDADARPAVTWAGRRGPLAIDGRTQLDLAAADQTTAAAYDRYLRDTAIQDALGIEADDARWACPSSRSTPPATPRPPPAMPWPRRTGA